MAGAINRIQNVSKTGMARAVPCQYLVDPCRAKYFCAVLCQLLPVCFSEAKKLPSARLLVSRGFSTLQGQSHPSLIPPQNKSLSTPNCLPRGFAKIQGLFFRGKFALSKPGSPGGPPEIQGFIFPGKRAVSPGGSSFFRISDSHISRHRRRRCRTNSQIPT